VRSQLASVPLPGAVCVVHLECIFMIPMPQSWSQKKRKALNGTPCHSKPDIDNLLKGVMDIIWDDDAGITSENSRKYWSDDPKTVIRIFS
jgi:Holliday junction resolvase RusA-like endonuclease